MTYNVFGGPLSFTQSTNRFPAADCCRCCCGWISALGLQCSTVPHCIRNGLHSVPGKGRPKVRINVTAVINYCMCTSNGSL